LRSSYNVGANIDNGILIMNKVNGNVEQAGKKPKIIFGGNEYSVDDLSNKAKNILGFLRRADEELADLRYSLDKVNLARKQAIADLSDALNEKDI